MPQSDAALPAAGVLTLTWFDVLALVSACYLVVAIARRCFSLGIRVRRKKE
jgi:hypothetical protein